MRRRFNVASVCAFSIALGLLAGPLRAEERIWRLGFLTPGVTESVSPGNIRSTTLQVLAQQGFVEGRNLVFIPAAANGDASRLDQLADELSRERVDVIIAVGTLAARAARRTTPATPIVLSFTAEDPVAAGFAASLARPAGSVTGIFFRAIETDGKRLELLSEALPSARVLGFLAAPTLEKERAQLLAQTAERLGIKLITEIVASPAEYQKGFENLRAQGAVGVLIMGTTIFAAAAPHLAALAAEKGLATVCEWDWMARDGCLIGYGPDLVGSSFPARGG